MSSGTLTIGALQASPRRVNSPPPLTMTTLAPWTAASLVASTVSSVLPEKETANTSVPSPTKAGSSYDLATTTGTGMNGPATAATMSPAMPLPPMPSTTTDVTSSIRGSPDSPFDRSAAAATCSGRVRVAASIPWESRARVPSIVTAWASLRRRWA